MKQSRPPDECERSIRPRHNVSGSSRWKLVPLPCAEPHAEPPRPTASTKVPQSTPLAANGVPLPPCRGPVLPPAPSTLLDPARAPSQQQHQAQQQAQQQARQQAQEQVQQQQAAAKLQSQQGVPSPNLGTQVPPEPHSPSQPLQHSLSQPLQHSPAPTPCVPFKPPSPRTPSSWCNSSHHNHNGAGLPSQRQLRRPPLARAI